MNYYTVRLASHVIPRLTTIAQPVEKIGETVTDLLFQQIQDPAMLSQTIKLETELVIREPTAPPR